LLNITCPCVSFFKGVQDRLDFLHSQVARFPVGRDCYFESAAIESLELSLELVFTAPGPQVFMTLSIT